MILYIFYVPLRTEVTTKYCTIDTKTVVQLFMKKQQNFLDNIELFKDYIWSEHFATKHKIFKLNNYSFDHTILTDGYCVSIRFIHNSYIEGNQIRNECKKIKKEEIKKMCENLTKEEENKLREKIKVETENKKKELKSMKNLKQKEKLKAERERIKKLSVEEQQLIKEEKNMKTEFPYIDKLSKSSLKTLEDQNKVYIDPGKKSLMRSVGDNKTWFNYTNRQRVSETKRLKYAKLKENHKKKPITEGETETITSIEKELNDYKSKSCDYDTFCLYIEKKTEVNKKLFSKYENKLFRKLRWFGFLNTKRSEANLLNKLKKIYGEKAIMIIGDWNDSGRLKYMSTLGVGLRRLLATEFKVYLIDEFRTSCLNNKTEERSENMYYTDKKGKIRKLHSVLMYKTSSGRLGCINRDRNAVLNMKKIVHHYINTGNRLERFSREIKIETKKSKKSKNNNNKSKEENLKGPNPLMGA
jgi:hypothetical protein